jgi:ABC-type phosphate transport system substrate-binding protein
VHVPFALGAIGFFHSVPADAVPTGELKLDACLLSKIFQRRIKTWDHADIMALNPGLTVPAGTKIRVVHRILGSSSTSGATEYMYYTNVGASDAMCKWDQEPGPGAESNWANDTYGASGSDGVSEEIDGNAYSIGYIDAGHGHNLGLGEVSLRNQNGNYLTSKEADIGAAAAVALDNNDLPMDSSASWADVNLYDKPGATTWPITMISYFYIRRDLTAYGASGTLLKAFVEYVLSPAGQAEATQFYFFPLPAQMLTYNAATMTGVVTAGGAPVWKFEEGSDSPDVYEGSGTFILSGKRGTYADYHRSKLEDTIATMQAKMEDMEVSASAIRTTAWCLKQIVASMRRTQASMHDASMRRTQASMHDASMRRTRACCIGAWCVGVRRPLRLAERVVCGGRRGTGAHVHGAGDARAAASRLGLVERRHQGAGGGRARVRPPRLPAGRLQHPPGDFSTHRIQNPSPC